jgi:hypothetical protein
MKTIQLILLKVQTYPKYIFVIELVILSPLATLLATSFLEWDLQNNSSENEFPTCLKVYICSWEKKTREYRELKSSMH